MSNQENLLEISAEALESLETTSGQSWLQRPASTLAEHLRMMETTGWNPRPQLPEGCMSEVVGWPGHLPAWLGHNTDWLQVIEWHELCFLSMESIAASTSQPWAQTQDYQPVNIFRYVASRT